MRHARAVPFALAVLTLAGWMPRAARSGEDLIPVADVAGKSRADAHVALSAQGFLVAVFEVAGTPEGTVAAQAPEKGTLLSAGGPVRIDVRVKPVASTAPDAGELAPAAAAAAVGEKFVAEFKAVSGEAKDKGKVVRQTPAAGEALDLRGTLVLEHVPDDALPPKAPVPNVLGLSQADAGASLAGAGFLARFSHTAIEYVPADISVAQFPPVGTEAARDSWVDVVVTTEPPVKAPPEAPKATVPNLMNLTESTARSDVEAAGLSPKVEKVEGDPSQAFLVVWQDPPAGASVDAGSEVLLRVVEYRPPAPPSPARVAVPSLIGMSQWQAEDLLVSLKLVPNPLPTENAEVPALRVFAQQTPEGTEVDEGSQVTFRVAKPPPSPAAVAVPNFFGKTKTSALGLAVTAGLTLEVQWIEDGTKPENLVFSQSIAAGTLVPPASVVAVQVAKHPAGPPMTVVPDLLGKTDGQASVALASAGLTGSPSFVYAPSKPVLRVFEQAIAAGTTVASGTTVAYKVAKLPDLVGVPDVVGKTKAHAEAILGAAGFLVHTAYVGPAGKPFNTVVSQDPGAGTALVVGSTVHLGLAGFKLPPPPLPLVVHVPNLSGKSFDQAKAALEGVGLVANGSTVVAPGKPIGQVFWQDPAPGALVGKGTAVAYRVAKPIFVPLPGPLDILVQVPNLIGLTPAQANAKLASKGLSSDGQIAFKLGKPAGKVYSQTPGAGFPLIKGATVKWKANP